MFWRQISLIALGAATLALGGCKDEPSPALDALQVPSGAEVRFLDVIHNVAGAEGTAARFRFIDPALSAGGDRSADLLQLCEAYALPRVEGITPAPRQVMISLADRETVFGEPSPDAIQLFEAYRIEEGRCIWELF